MSQWTDEEIMKQVMDTSALNVKDVNVTDHIDTKASKRDILIIGCGDGGCNIASDIYKAIPGIKVIAYNTSSRGIENISATTKIIPAAEDGSGKDRAYSLNVLREGVYKQILSNAQALLNSMDNPAYVIVISTTDGGTGSGVSPVIAKLINDNVEQPVIAFGVYPAITEDATAQFNAMNWQKEVSSYGLPYAIFDNNITGNTKSATHNIINQEVVTTVKLLAGKTFDNTNISMIDNRDLMMLLSHLGDRIVATSKTQKPTIGQSLDDFIIDMLNRCHQPLPSDVRGIGVFVKGSADFLDKIDTSLGKVKSIFGEASVQYTHLEESSITTIGVILSGCTDSSPRLSMMRERYDDIMNNQRANRCDFNSILSGVGNPLGTTTKKSVGGDPDLSALGL